MAGLQGTATYNFPISQEVVNKEMKLAEKWVDFFRQIKQALTFLGAENSFTLVNNLAVAADIENLSFSKNFTSHAVIDYCIQRTTNLAGLTQSGCLHAVYKPFTNTWALVPIGTPGPDVAGITFSITSDGKIQYTSTNQAGTVVLSRIFFRVRAMAGKAYYSKVG